MVRFSAPVVSSRGASICGDDATNGTEPRGDGTRVTKRARGPRWLGWWSRTPCGPPARPSACAVQLHRTSKRVNNSRWQPRVEPRMTRAVYRNKDARVWTTGRLDAGRLATDDWRLTTDEWTTWFYVVSSMYPLIRSTLFPSPFLPLPSLLSSSFLLAVLPGGSRASSTFRLSLRLLLLALSHNPHSPTPTLQLPHPHPLPPLPLRTTLHLSPSPRC